MLTVLIIIHILISVVLILSILLQSGKGGSLAGALGGAGAAGAVLGTRGAATMLSKITTYASVLFLVSCLGLSFMFKGGRGSEQIQTAAQKEAAKRRTGLTPMAPAPVRQQTQAPAQSVPAPTQQAEKK